MAKNSIKNIIAPYDTQHFAEVPSKLCATILLRKYSELIGFHSRAVRLRNRSTIFIIIEHKNDMLAVTFIWM